MRPFQSTATPETLDGHADGPRARQNGARRDDPRRNGRGLWGKFREQPVLNSLLVLLCAAAIIAALTLVGPESQSSAETTRTTTVRNGVVQSTVSGSGSIQSADQLDLGFKTDGTVTHIYVKSGQHVSKGELLATLDPSSSEVTLEQAKATLQSAEANLAKLEEDEGESTTTGGSTNASAASSGSTSDATETASSASATAGKTELVSDTTETTTTTTTEQPGTTTTPKPEKTPAESKPSKKSDHSSKPTKTSETTASSDAGSSDQGSTTGTSSTTKQSAATREANLASARAAVKSDKLSVQSAEEAVQNTKLYAPESGTIVSLSGEVGETVSGTGTSRATTSSSSDSSGSGSSGAGAGGSSSTGASSSSSSSSSGSSSSSSFAVLSDLSSLQVVVPVSEAEIGNVHVGQVATVTIEALSGRKVGAHVVSISQLPTSSSGAVSYDVTFQLDQLTEGLKVGMSATAEVIVKQAEGLNVPTSAIKADSVTVLHNGKQESRPVTTGLAGNSTTIVLSGVKEGEEVVLPSSSGSRSSSTSGLASKLSRGGGFGGLGGGGFGGGGFAGGPPGG